MRRRAAHSRDTLQADRLPTTEHMELNYRPAMAPSPLVATAVGFELGILGFLLFLALLTLSWIAPALGFGVLFAWTIPLLLLCVSPLAIAEIDFEAVGTRQAWAFWGIAAILLIALAQLASLAAVYFLVLGAALAFSVLLALLIAKQAAYWMTAHPRVDWREVRKWRSTWSQLFHRDLPTHCPEMLTLRAALVALLVQFYLGYEFFAWRTGQPAPADQVAAAGWQVMGVLFLPLPIYWLIWNFSGVVPRLPIRATLRATQLALQIWFAYLPIAHPRPGVFLLPTKWLRSGSVRQLCFFAAIGALTVAVFLVSHAHLTPPSQQFQIIASPPIEFDNEADWTLRGMPVALALTILLPPLIFTLLLWFLTGSLLARYWLALESPGAYDQSANKSAWAIAVNRIINSRDVREKKHILLGRAIFGDYPVLLDRGLLHQHAHLIGDSGSRKTSLGIAPTIAQLIAPNNASVVVLDLKGDPALFETARLEAESAGAEFRWFTPEPDHSSHVFNPLEQSHLERFTPSQRTQFILEALALNYGDSYGRGYFSAVSESVLLNFLRRFHVRNFIELHKLVTDRHAYAAVGLPDEPKDARHLSALLDRLTSISNLNVTRQSLADRPAVAAAAIDMAQLLARPQVVYFNLRSAVGSITSPAIAKLVMYSLFSAAADRQPDQTLQVYVVIDEFQQIVSENIPLVMEQARSSKLTFLIAHQSLDQLDRKAIDIRNTVSACTAFKQFFRASNPDTIKHLEAMAGEGVFELLTWDQSVDATLGIDHDQSFSPLVAKENVVTVTETIASRLERNTIIDVSATANTSFIMVTEGSEFTQFSGYVTPIVTDYHISPDQYEQRNSASWPAANEQTVIVERPASPLSIDSPSATEVFSVLDERPRAPSVPVDAQNRDQPTSNLPSRPDSQPTGT